MNLNQIILNDQDFDNIQSYGISVISAQDKIEIKNISPCKEFVQELISKMKSLGVSQLHVLDIVEDSLI